MRAVIMLPTYNERDNIERLIRALDSLFIQDLRYLIIDDNSPDGTGELADTLASSNAHVEVLHRKKKEGLGRAYVDGFQYAISKMGAECIFTMDADFSHDHTKIPEFLRAIGHADLVIGSRYTEGGKIENWSMFRKLLSACGNVYARTVLGLPMRDLTTGYMCFRKEVIETIGLNRLVANGYVFLIELKKLTHQHGFQITEIPITFTERREGASKFNFSIFYEAFFKVLHLRFKDSGRSLPAERKRTAGR